MAAYSYFYNDYYNRAISEILYFFKKYPNHPKHLPYAHYLLAMSYYNSIVDEKKDLEPLKKFKKTI
jgi:outer membrane protein assembly factor BamD